MREVCPRPAQTATPPRESAGDWTEGDCEGDCVLRCQLICDASLWRKNARVVSACACGAKPHASCFLGGCRLGSRVAVVKVTLEACANTPVDGSVQAAGRKQKDMPSLRHMPH